MLLIVTGTLVSPFLPFSYTCKSRTLASDNLLFALHSKSVNSPDGSYKLHSLRIGCMKFKRPMLAQSPNTFAVWTVRF